MNLRFSEEFNRIEWIGNQETRNLVDPLDIQVVLHDQSHSVYLEGKAVRASRGRYFVDFDAGSLIPGQTYSIFWRYNPIADVVQVKRHDFLWQDILTNENDDYCLIYGRITDGVGIPLFGKEIQILQYDDFVTKDRILSEVTETTDAYGQWRFLAIPGRIYQILFHNRMIKTFKAPVARTINYSDLVPYDYNTARKDSFGNPIDGLTLSSTVQQYFLR